MNEIYIVVSFILFSTLTLIFLYRTTKYNHFNTSNDIRELEDLQRKKKRTADETLELANIYYNGIDDKIRPDGSLSKGVEPDFHKAIKYYKKLTEIEGYDKYLSCLKLGDIYNNGYVGYYDIVDKNKARQYYLRCSESAYEDLRLIAINKIMDLNNELHMPALQDVIQNIEVLNVERITEPDEPKAKIINDPQNVHDSTVIKYIKNAIDTLETDNVTEDPIKKLQEVVVKSSGKICEEKIKLAVKALQDMKSSNASMSGLGGKTEVEIANAIYNKYTTMTKEEKDNFSHNLTLQMCDAIQHGKTVCSAGRMERLVTSISDIDVKPLWAVKQEMLNVSSKFRDTLLEDYSEKEIEAINNPQNRVEMDLSDEFDNKYKRHIKRKLKEDYVDTGIIDEAFIQKEVEGWF